jgi:spermidine/putrescine transport system ATP-binding protein
MLELDELTVNYGNMTAVDSVSLSIEIGELFCLLGPSGSGKSTVLRTIAGFESPSAGEILLDGAQVTATPPYDRDCSMVFQDWALFPHQTVLENVAFGLKMNGASKQRRHERARESLELVEMTGYETSRPDQLSGGQKQRVALARSLTVDPELLLLDEPLSNLDRQLRETMQLELKRIHDRVGTTMLYVTHDQDEAFTLGDRMGVMNEGRLVQVDTPRAIYEDPTNQFVESFLGTTNFIQASVSSVDKRPQLSTEMGVEFLAPIDGRSLRTGDEMMISVRPERLSVSTASDATVVDGGVPQAEKSVVSVTATVNETIHRGSDVRVQLTVGETTVFVERSAAAAPLAPGEDVTIQFWPDEATYFDGTRQRCR